MTVGARLLTNHAGKGFRFDPGNFSLELLLTGGPPPYDIWEILNTTEAFPTWIAESRLTIGNPLDPADVHVTPAELARIRAFRDALWSLAPALAHGERLDTAALDVVNHGVADTPRVRLDSMGARRWDTPVTGTQILGAAARDAVEMIGTDLRERVRQCQGGRCALMFLDTSRPGNRRWCSMERCGNRHKVSSYRTRGRE